MSFGIVCQTHNIRVGCDGVEASTCFWGCRGYGEVYTHSTAKTLEDGNSFVGSYHIEIEALKRSKLKGDGRDLAPAWARSQREASVVALCLWEDPWDVLSGRRWSLHFITTSSTQSTKLQNHQNHQVKVITTLQICKDIAGRCLLSKESQRRPGVASKNRQQSVRGETNFLRCLRLWKQTSMCKISFQKSVEFEALTMQISTPCRKVKACTLHWSEQTQKTENSKQTQSNVENVQHFSQEGIKREKFQDFTVISNFCLVLDFKNQRLLLAL